MIWKISLLKLWYKYGINFKMFKVYVYLSFYCFELNKLVEVEIFIYIFIWFFVDEMIEYGKRVIFGWVVLFLYWKLICMLFFEIDVYICFIYFILLNKMSYVRCLFCFFILYYVVVDNVVFYLYM